jgi:23S rRNA maturation-related 3'-5' exoribonuclease YhaM
MKLNEIIASIIMASINKVLRINCIFLTTYICDLKGFAVYADSNMICTVKYHD